MITAPIRAILINPTARTVTEIELPTRPGNPEECYGTQPARGALLAAIGCQSIEIFNLDKSNQCVVDGKSLWAETPPTDFWQYGPNCEPIAGIGVITGHGASFAALPRRPTSKGRFTSAPRWLRRLSRRNETMTALIFVQSTAARLGISIEADAIVSLVEAAHEGAPTRSQLNLAFAKVMHGDEQAQPHRVKQNAERAELQSSALSLLHFR